MEQYVEPKEKRAEQVDEKIICQTTKQVVKMVINEPLPGSKELTAAVEGYIKR